VALLAGVILVGTAVTASASIPDSQNTIHGCYATKGGTLRVIDTDAGATCAKGEQAITWNQQGPAGPQGPTGPAGASGGLVYFYSNPIEMPPGYETSFGSGCGSTVYHAISGGWEAYTNPNLPLSSAYYDVRLAASGPEIGTGNFVSQPTEVTPGTSENGLWVFHFKNVGTQSAYLKTYVVCMRLSAPTS
jgi:hypothetical protein